MVLPVKQDDIYMGLAEISGLLRLESDSLILEYQVKDDVLGMFDSKMKLCKIPVNIIDFAEVEKKWFIWRFNIYLNRLLPSAKTIRIKENCLSFKFKKKDLEKAKSLKTRIMIELSEQKLKDLEDDEPVQSRVRKQHKSHAKDPEPIEFQEEEQKKDNPGTGTELKNMLRNDDRD